jgi:hypothetical protein
MINNLNRHKSDFQPSGLRTNVGASRAGPNASQGGNINASLSNVSLNSVASNANPSSANGNGAMKKSAVGEIKRLKVQFIQANVSAPNVNLSFQINPKTWPNLGINELIEISSNPPPASSSNSTHLANASGILATSSLNRGANQANAASSSLLSSSTVSSSSSTAQMSAVTASASSTSTTQPDDDTSPFLVHVAQTSFIESLASDTICIDRAATAAPFSIKPLSYVWATVVERDVIKNSFLLEFRTKNRTKTKKSRQKFISTFRLTAIWFSRQNKNQYIFSFPVQYVF